MTVCASKFNWNEGFGYANSTEIFGTWSSPDEFYVQSPKTQKVLKFKLDKQEAIENESWDGEFKILRTEDKQFAIKMWNY